MGHTICAQGVVKGESKVSENPKLIQALKDGKVPFELIPMGPMAGVARVLAGGAEKYGARNWRIDKIKASTYEGAIGRHTFLEWAAGQDVDKDSGEHPLAHVIASCLIVLDALECDTLIDDRNRQESKNEQRDNGAVDRSAKECADYIERLNNNFRGQQADLFSDRTEPSTDRQSTCRTRDPADYIGWGWKL